MTESASLSKMMLTAPVNMNSNTQMSRENIGISHLLSFILTSFRSKRGVMSSYNLIISYFFRCVKFFLIHGFVDKAYLI